MELFYLLVLMGIILTIITTKIYFGLTTLQKIAMLFFLMIMILTYLYTSMAPCPTKSAIPAFIFGLFGIIISVIYVILLLKSVQKQ